MNEPTNPDAERAILGAVLHRPDALADLDTLPAEAFGDPKCRAVWRAMLRLWERREPATIITVPSELLAMGGRDRAAAGTFVADLYTLADPNEVMFAAYHAGVLLQTARRRAVFDGAAALVKSAHEGEPDIEAAFASIREAVAPFVPAGSGGDAAALMADLQERAMRVWSGEDRASVTPSGIAMLDRMLNGGMRPGELLVVAGRPSMGKTQMMLRMAQPARRRALVVSLEMSAVEIGNRLACGVAGVPYGVAVSEVGDVEQRERFLHATETVADWPVIVTEAERTTDAIARRVAQEQAAGGISAVFVDHLDWLEDRFPGKVSDYERTSALSRRCKLIAKRCGVPVVLLSQLNRDVEGRSGCVPYMSDLRDSGKLEQDANAVLLLYRRAYYSSRGMGGLKPDQDDYITGHAGWDRLTINVAKNRNGITGSLDLGWDGATMTIHEVDGRMAA